MYQLFIESDLPDAKMSKRSHFMLCPVALTNVSCHLCLCCIFFIKLRWPKNKSLYDTYGLFSSLNSGKVRRYVSLGLFLELKIC